MNRTLQHEARTAREYLHWMEEGALTSEKLVRHCLDTIDRTDGQVGAWESIDPEYALEQAREMDDLRKRGRALGLLHGVPVGVKDIIDTARLPTRLGSKAFADRRPQQDSAVVEKLREAGAIILGKTVTTEMAFMHPAGTRNPRNFDYGPGGSSSGSASAVAAGQVPLAIGSQTHGSTIRPASFCGVYGYKPTRGIVSRRGMLGTSPHLDQVGMFALDAGDLAVLADALGGYDAADSQSYLRPRPGMVSGHASEVPVEPCFAWFDLPYSGRYSPELEAGSEELLTALGRHVERVQAPRSFAGLIESLRIIYHYELYRSLSPLGEQLRPHVSEVLHRALDTGKGLSDELYRDALEAKEAAERWFGTWFNDHDAIITPSAPGIAPRFGAGTGDPVCCTIWTLCGLPCISLPLLEGAEGLPIGIQLVGGADEDDRLFRTVRWLLGHLGGESDPVQDHETAKTGGVA